MLCYVTQYECQFVSLFLILLHEAIHCSLEIHILCSFSIYLELTTPVAQQEKNTLCFYHLLPATWEHHISPPLKKKHFQTFVIFSPDSEVLTSHFE